MKEILSGSQKCGEVVDTLKKLHQKSSGDSLSDMFDDTGYDDMGDILDNLGNETETEESDEDVDYSKMSKREIETLINQALDAGDFDLVEKLHKYI